MCIEGELKIKIIFIILAFNYISDKSNTSENIVSRGMSAKSSNGLFNHCRVHTLNNLRMIIATLVNH